MAKIIAVVSGKGGTGKSTVSAALSYYYAKKGATVLLCDLDIGLRSLDIMLGLEHKVVYDLGDVLDKRVKLVDAMAKHKIYSGLRLLCAPLSITKTFDVSKTIGIIKMAATDDDYIILDLPAGLGLSVMMAKELSDIVCIVTTPDNVTIRDSRKICDEISLSSEIPCELIINHVSKATLTTSGIANLDEIIDAVGAPLLGVLKEDEWVQSYFNNDAQKQCSRDSKKALDAIARRIDGEYVPLAVKTL